MKCDQCGQPASLHITEIAGGEKRRVSLCPPCARAKGVFVEAAPEAGAGAGPPRLAVTRPCPRCGRTLAALRKEGRVGCAECYRTFRPELRKLLEKVHGASSHRSRGSSSPGKSQP